MSEQVKDYPPYLDYPKPRKKQTNADRIREMTDEELADLRADVLCDIIEKLNDVTRLNIKYSRTQFVESYLDWLKEEVK